MSCDVVKEWLEGNKFHIELECNMPVKPAAEAETMAAGEGEPAE